MRLVRLLLPGLSHYNPSNEALTQPCSPGMAAPSCPRPSLRALVARRFGRNSRAPLRRVSLPLVRRAMDRPDALAPRRPGLLHRPGLVRRSNDGISRCHGGGSARQPDSHTWPACGRGRCRRPMVARSRDAGLGRRPGPAGRRGRGVRDRRSARTPPVASLVCRIRGCRCLLRPCLHRDRAPAGGAGASAQRQLPDRAKPQARSGRGPCNRRRHRRACRRARRVCPRFRVLRRLRRRHAGHLQMVFHDTGARSIRKPAPGRPRGAFGGPRGALALDHDPGRGCH